MQETTPSRADPPMINIECVFRCHIPKIVVLRLVVVVIELLNATLGMKDISIGEK